MPPEPPLSPSRGPRPRLVVVVGPTASGKTALAVRLAEVLGGEVIGADSVQIYRRFDVGAGKPTAEERERAPHHLVDACEPDEPVDAARWVELADACIEGVARRGKVPIVCGGTFLWVRSLLRGLAPMPPADAALRARHAALVAAEGRPALHARLAAADPAAAARLAPNDVVRVSRALEVHELSGRTMSAWHADHGFRGRRHDATMIALRHDPAALTERIERRITGWLDTGWLDEVSGLLDAGYRSARAMGSVGYAEVKDHVDGKLARDELVAAITRSTRIFARRQRTWLNSAAVDWF